MYLKSFWKVLPLIFTKDFWFVNNKLKAYKDLQAIKCWAKQKGYRWDNTFYMDGEKYFWKGNVKVCMVQPYNWDVFTRYYAHQPEWINLSGKEPFGDGTFLLNRHKTAKYIFYLLNKEAHLEMMVNLGEFNESVLEIFRKNINELK